MSDVRPREGGPYSLYCYSCGEWVPNTANSEMKKEGAFSYSHICRDGKLVFGDGANEELAKENDQEELDVNCKCGKGYNWDEHIDGTMPPENPEFVKWFLRKLDAPDEFMKIEKAYHIDCDCGNKFVVAEVLEMCEPDENGFSDSAYLTLSFSSDEDEE